MCTLGHFRKKSAMAAISIRNDMTDEVLRETTNTNGLVQHGSRLAFVKLQPDWLPFNSLGAVVVNK